LKASWRDCFEEHATTDEYQAALRGAEALVRDAIGRCTRPYVAFSGGKDSTAMLHLVLQQRPECEVLHWDYGRYYIPRELHAELVTIPGRVGARALRLESSPEYERLGRTAQNVLGREMIEKLLPAMAEEGFDMSFVGLRKQESTKRRLRIDAERMVGPIPECWPLRDWTWMDVWAYIVQHDLPYLSIYDERCELVGYAAARFTTLFDPEFYAMGSESVDNVLHWRWRNAPGGR
jgi:phosphoadenosine phosphosulfate reductase